MTAPGNLNCKLWGRNEAGDYLAGFVAAKLTGPVVRSIGTAGDSLTLIVKKSAWRPDGLDISQPMKIEIGQTGSTLSPGGYMLLSELPGTFGTPHDDPEADVAPLEVMLRFVTIIGWYRDSRGGLLQEQTYNPLKKNGLVDEAHADYRTMSQLATLALSAIELDYIPAPVSMNVADPPAPLDWGNCRALPELDGLCRRCGHAVVLNNAGNELSIVRLPLGGEAITIPALDEGVLQPYELSDGPSIRPTRLIIHSGRTRSTILTDRTLDAFEWVWKDSRTGRWLNDTQTAALYSGETEPGDIDAFKAAPPKDQTKRAEFKRLFSALRIKEEERESLKRFVNFPDHAEVVEGKDLGGESCVVFARCAVELKAGQLRNVEGPESAMVRIDGARAITGEGVVTLPSEALMVRMSPGPAGGYGNAIALTDEDLQVVFAIQAHTGEPLTDYFIVGYNSELDAGNVVVTEMTEEELDEAMLDPSVPSISHDWLQRVLIWPDGESEPTDTNDADLKAATEKIAAVRMAGAGAKSGIITLRGLHNIEPGAWGGFVSSVQWDQYRMITVLSVGQHEVPGGVMEAIELSAHRSFIAGFGRFTLPGSAVELSETRAGGGPGVLGQVTGAAAPGDARGSSSTRGAESSLPATAIGLASAPTLARAGDAYEFTARVTGNTSVGTNKWKYSFEEVSHAETPGTYTTVSGGRTHTTHGYAYNGMEAANDGSGVQGNGVDVDTLPDGFDIQPIATGTIHTMIGPFGAGETTWVRFSAPNGVDGECE